MPGAGVDRWHEATDSWRSVDSRKLLPRRPERGWGKFLDQQGGASVECEVPV